MEVAVIGLGSMGKRRIKLLQKNVKDIIVYGVDLRKDRRDEAQSLLGIETYSTLEELRDSNISAVIICTSPNTHQDMIKQAIDYRLHVFTEINLNSKYYDKILDLAAQNNVKLFLSSTFLYRKEIQYINSLVEKSNRKIFYRYHVGQYLKDWHPWESYRDFFVAHKETNGCREIFAIELPWIIEVFGHINNYLVVKNKVSNLDIDYPDNYSVILEHNNGTVGTINVNLVSKIAKRDFELIGEEFQVQWNGSPTGLHVWNNEKNKMENIILYNDFINDKAYASSIIEDAYLEELNEFLRYIAGEITEPKYSFEKDKYILQVIDGVEGDI